MELTTLARGRLLDLCALPRKCHHRGAFLGVPATGRSVSTQEFAVYRIDADKIVEVWVAADSLRLLDQLR